MHRPDIPDATTQPSPLIAATAVLCAVTASLLWQAPARAIDLESLIMPGPVIRGHAEVETQCRKCHQPFRGSSERDLCLACHEKVAEDVRTQRGFHGRDSGPRRSACRSCHGEHLGRDADVTGLDPEAFDHGTTDYPLRDSHLRVACADCHAAGKKYREAPSACIACHREDDVHKGRLGKRCQDCHAEANWREANFDHAKTDFPLEGEHVKVECGLCHPNERYKKTPVDCYACHRLNDAHRGRFGKKCETCHSPRGWKQDRFDHDRDTDWPLHDRHRQAECNDCHRGDLYGKKLPRDCVGCHRADDAHRGRNGRRCEECHGPSGWKKLHFEHDRDTEYPLRGAHAKTRCTACHKGILHEEKMKENSCFSCHREDDVHHGQQGRACEECHNESSWADDVFFDHELTKFPLLALHAAVSCEDCHSAGTFKDASLLCNDCHASDDVHKRRLGPNCARCHTPNGWPIWRFDHDRQTDFPLRNAHENLDCHACHRRSARRKVALSHACYTCHAQDDAHRGAFGRRCEKCHEDTRWRDAELKP